MPLHSELLTLFSEISLFLFYLTRRINTKISILKFYNIRLINLDASRLLKLSTRVYQLYYRFSTEYNKERVLTIECNLSTKYLIGTASMRCMKYNYQIYQAN